MRSVATTLTCHWPLLFQNAASAVATTLHMCSLSQTAFSAAQPRVGSASAQQLRQRLWRGGASAAGMNSATLALNQEHMELLLGLPVLEILPVLLLHASPGAQRKSSPCHRSYWQMRHPVLSTYVRRWYRNRREVVHLRSMTAMRTMIRMRNTTTCCQMIQVRLFRFHAEKMMHGNRCHKAWPQT